MEPAQDQRYVAGHDLLGAADDALDAGVRAARDHHHALGRLEDQALLRDAASQDAGGVHAGQDLCVCGYLHQLGAGSHTPFECSREGARRVDHWPYAGVQ